MEPIFELPIRLPPSGSRRLLRTLHDQLRAAVLDGRLQPGIRMPSTRTLARAHGVSRNTAVAAYDMLISEGYLVTRPGSGTFVAKTLPRASRPKQRTADKRGDRRLDSFWRDPPRGVSTSIQPPPRYDFRFSAPDTQRFPFDIWRRLTARALRAMEKVSTTPAEIQGREALREAIAGHVSFTRAVACEAEDIIVTAGAQQAFDLLTRILVTPGRTVVALEDPGYRPLYAAFEAAGAKVVPVRVDDEGMVVEQLPRDTGIICVTPSHQFPLGNVMSARRRAELMEFARAGNAVVIEDDYDSEFRFGGRPLDALQTLDCGDTVFYVGTFSKSLFPAIRIGFIVAPAWARAALVAARRCADLYGDMVAQDTLADFIAEGHLARHLRRMRRVYGARRRVLLNRLQNDFNHWFTLIPSIAGLHSTALAKPGLDIDTLMEQARRDGVGLYSLNGYFHGRPQSGLMFGYGTLEEEDITEGLTRLRKLVADHYVIPAKAGI